MGYYQIHDEQVVKTDINNLWNFVSDPSNLKKLTPSKLGFKMMTSTHTEMTEGMIITYRITPLLNIGVKWVTEISHVKKQNYFIDKQVYGPYKLWHHQHLFQVIDEHHVRMTDIVTYALPFGIIGDFVNFMFIRRKLKTVFDYRKVALNKIFNT